MAHEGRYSIWDFTWGDEQDDGTWWHDLAGTTSTYVNAAKRTTIVAWDELLNTTRRGTIRQASAKKSSISHSESAIATVFKAYMVANHPGCREPADIKFQHSYKDVGVGKTTKRTVLDVLNGAKDALILDNKPVTTSNLEMQIAKDSFPELKRTRSEIPSFVGMESDDDFLMRPIDSEEDAIRNSQVFVRGLLVRLTGAVYHTPIQCTHWSHRDKVLFTFGTLTLSAASFRKKNDGMFGLMLMGAEGVGKSSSFVDNGQLEKIPSDAPGVGRFKVAASKTTILCEEWTMQLLIDPSNFNTVKQIALGSPTSVKVHSGFTTLHPLWCGLTTNDTYADLERATSHLSPAHKGALRRRVICVEWVDSVDDLDLTIIGEGEMDLKLTRALMVVQLLRLTRDDALSVLNTFGPINSYIRVMYGETYRKAKRILLQNGVKHTDIVLSFQKAQKEQVSSTDDDEPTVAVVHPDTTGVVAVPGCLE